MSADFVRTRPRKLSALMAFSTASASEAEGSISGREESGKYRLPVKGKDEQPRGQYLIGRDDLMVTHFLSPLWLQLKNSRIPGQARPREARDRHPSPCHGRRISTTMGAEAHGMYRSISTQAIVIRRERLGEFHKSLTLLTSDLGLISATAYGAYKMHSHLRVGSEPFTWSHHRAVPQPGEEELQGH